MDLGPASPEAAGLDPGSGQDACNYMPDPGHLLPCVGSDPAVPTSPLVSTSLPNLPRFRTGKVRDVYDLGDSLLIVKQELVDPDNLNTPYWASPNFKRQNDAAGWNPTPCSAR